MSNEAKVIALEHLVVALLKDLEVRKGIPSQPIVEAALHSIKHSDYPGDAERRLEAVGALQDLWSLIGAESSS